MRKQGDARTRAASAAWGRVGWTLWLSCLVAQVLLAFLFHSGHSWRSLRIVGWGLWALSALLGWLPTFTLKTLGDVPAGKSYTHTRRLVTGGVYDVVRHPQYLSFMLLSVALACISQHWAMLPLAVAGSLGAWLIVRRADVQAWEKFGSAYDDHMARVPGLNPIVGLWRRWRHDDRAADND